VYLNLVALNAWVGACPLCLRFRPPLCWHVDMDRSLVQNSDMNKAEVISKLRKHEPELKAAGIVHLRLHGSVAREDARRDSDIDLIAEFDPQRRFSLVGMAGLERRLGKMLGVRVDLSPANTLKEPVAAKASREAVLAF
jgi:uncharacterized protein